MEAIIIVDLQQAFPVPPEVVRSIKERSQNFRLRVFTKIPNEPDSLFCRKLKRSSCLPGAADRELLIEPSPGDLVIDKRGYGFTAQQVEQLRGAGIKKTQVCGVDPSLCWSSTGLHDEELTIVREQFGTG